MKQVKSLQVGGKEIKVLVEPFLWRETGNRGEYRIIKNEIAIQGTEGEVPDNMTQTLIHEVIEVIKNVWLDGSLEHHYIDPLAEALLQVLKQLGLRLEWTEDGLWIA